MNHETLSVGIDVSRDELVIAYADDRRSIEHVANTAAAIQRWLKSLPAGTRIGLEATGAYHRRVADLAVAAGHVVYVLNPREVAHYLQSLRSRARPMSSMPVVLHGSYATKPRIAIPTSRPRPCSGISPRWYSAATK